MTELEALEIVNTTTRCTEATLKAFGISGYPLCDTGTLEFISRAGYQLTPIKFKEGITLKKFYVDHVDMTKDYHIKTQSHAMACIKGVLIDTMREGWNKRRVLFAWEVTK